MRLHKIVKQLVYISLLPLRIGPLKLYLENYPSVFAEVELGTRTGEDITLDRQAPCGFSSKFPFELKGATYMERSHPTPR